LIIDYVARLPRSGVEPRVFSMLEGKSAAPPDPAAVRFRHFPAIGVPLKLLFLRTGAMSQRQPSYVPARYFRFLIDLALVPHQTRPALMALDLEYVGRHGTFAVNKNRPSPTKIATRPISQIARSTRAVSGNVTAPTQNAPTARM